jgi:hypothetical protein
VIHVLVGPCFGDPHPSRNTGLGYQGCYLTSASRFSFHIPSAFLVKILIMLMKTGLAATGQVNLVTKAAEFYFSADFDEDTTVLLTK